VAARPSSAPPLRQPSSTRNQQALGKIRARRSGSKHVVHMSKARLATEPDSDIDASPQIITQMRDDTLFVWNDLYEAHKASLPPDDPEHGLGRLLGNSQ
jgi:hypothetical protein